MPARPDVGEHEAIRRIPVAVRTSCRVYASFQAPVCDDTADAHDMPDDQCQLRDCLSRWPSRTRFRGRLSPRRTRRTCVLRKDSAVGWATCAKKQRIQNLTRGDIQNKMLNEQLVCNRTTDPEFDKQSGRIQSTTSLDPLIFQHF